MVEKRILDTLEVGIFLALFKIHKYLFEEIYKFTGEVIKVNIAKGTFRFAPVMYLEVSLQNMYK